MAPASRGQHERLGVERVAGRQRLHGCRLQHGPESSPQVPHPEAEELELNAREDEAEAASSYAQQFRDTVQHRSI